MGLFTPKWKHKDPGVRLHAVEELTSLTAVRSIRESDPDSGVRGAAAARVQKLCAEKAKQSTPRERALEYLDELSDAELLGDVARHALDPSVRNAAIERIDSRAVLQSLALGTSEPRERVAALRKFADSPFLIDLVQREGSGVMRLHIVRLLEDQRSLARQGLKDPVWPVRLGALRRLTEANLRALIAALKAPKWLQEIMAGDESPDSMVRALFECAQRQWWRAQWRIDIHHHLEPTVLQRRDVWADELDPAMNRWPRRAFVAFTTRLLRRRLESHYSSLPDELLEAGVHVEEALQFAEAVAGGLSVGTEAEKWLADFSEDEEVPREAITHYTDRLLAVENDLEATPGWENVAPCAIACVESISKVTPSLCVLYAYTTAEQDVAARSASASSADSTALFWEAVRRDLDSLTQHLEAAEYSESARIAPTVFGPL